MGMFRNIKIGLVSQGNNVELSDENGVTIEYLFHDKNKASHFSGCGIFSNIQKGEDVSRFAGKDSVKSVKINIPEKMPLTDAIKQYVPKGTEYLDIKRYDSTENRTYDFKFNSNANTFEVKRDNEIISEGINYDNLNPYDKQGEDAMKVREFLQSLTEGKQEKINIDPSYGNYYLSRLSKPKFNDTYFPVRNVDEKSQLTEIIRHADDNTVAEVTLSLLDEKGNITDDSITAILTDCDATDKRISELFSVQYGTPTEVLQILELNYGTSDIPAIESVHITTTTMQEGLKQLDEISKYRTSNEPLGFELKTLYGDGVNFSYNPQINEFCVEYKGESIVNINGKEVYSDTDIYPDTLAAAMKSFSKELEYFQSVNVDKEILEGLYKNISEDTEDKTVDL